MSIVLEGKYCLVLLHELRFLLWQMHSKVTMDWVLVV